MALSTKTQAAVQAIIEQLDLLPHPEGGFYKEVYRSAEHIHEKNRDLLTSIYFLLTSDHVSKFHRIKSDEIWYFHAGSPLHVHTLSAQGHQIHIIGNQLHLNQNPQFTVSGNTIFGSSIAEEDAFSLVSCAVAPGFDFRDFELFDFQDLIKLYPAEQEIISRLT